MYHAQISGGSVVAVAPAPTQPGWDDGRWWDFTDPAEVSAWLDAGGWVPVTETPRPADTDTTTSEVGWAITGDTVTQTWTPRPWTADENAAAGALVAASTTETTRVSLEDVVAAAVRKGGALSTIIGATTDTAGVTSLRAMNKMTKAQIAADPAAVLVKLLPMLRDLAIVERRSGKLIVRLYDESS